MGIILHFFQERDRKRQRESIIKVDSCSVDDRYGFLFIFFIFFFIFFFVLERFFLKHEFTRRYIRTYIFLSVRRVTILSLSRFVEFSLFRFVFVLKKELKP